MKRKLGFLLATGLLFSGIVPAMTSCSDVDYLSQVKLDLDKSAWENSDFLTTGIGVVTLKNGVDGDTAHFYSKSNKVVAGRFNGVDTPESTGKLEEWGKTASRYTTGLLENAKTILLETDRGPTKGELTHKAEADSTGSRYMVWVWVSDRTIEEEDGSGFTLVNLGLVQNGLSPAKGISGTYYEDEFLDADAQAQKNKLYIWSGELDPEFNYGGAINITLKEFWRDPEAYDGGYYSFEGIVTKKVGDDAYVEYYEPNELTGEMERYGMFIFTMYAKTSSRYFKVGRKLNIVANISSRFGNFQAHNTEFPVTSTAGDPERHTYFADSETYEVMAPEVLTADDFNNAAKQYELMNSLVKLEGLRVTYGYGGLLEIDRNTNDYYDDNAMTLYCKDANNNSLQVRISDTASVKNLDGGTVKTYTYFTNLSEQGVTFDFVGFKQKYESETSGNVTFQLMLYTASDITYYGLPEA